MIPSILQAFAGNVASERREDFYVLPAGNIPNHLLPIAARSPEYELRLSQQLFVTSWSCGRLLIMPEFEPKSCLCVYAGSTDDPFLKETDKEYFVTLTRAAESIWHSMQREPGKRVKIDRVDRKISYELACAIQRVWARALQNTRYSTLPPEPTGGVRYRFSVYSGIELHGEALSPAAGFPVELASLGEELVDFVSDGRQGEAAILKKLRTFEEKIPAPGR